MKREHGEYSCGLENDAITVKFSPIDPAATIAQELRVSFRRTLRVPDNASVFKLPPGFGKFPLFNVRNYASRLPPEMVAKGGVFLPMYQKEAMWVKFAADSPFMIKIYVGGINVVSGEHAMEDTETKLRRRDLMKTGKSIQDYVVVPGQRWVDGIATSPGILRQFVAMPMGEGYSVEAQLTGKEVVGGLQFEITPVNPETVEARRRRYQKEETGLPNPVWGRLPKPEGGFFISVKMLTGKLYRIDCSPSDTIGSIENWVQAKEGIPTVEQRLLFGGERLSKGRKLSDYNIQKGSILCSFLCLSGGAGGDLMPNAPNAAMGIAAGGKIEQEIQRDGTDPDSWNRDMTITIPVQILNSAAFRRVTGQDPPPCPITASAYAAAGLPFFKLYEEPSGIAGDFAAVKSVNQIEQNRGIAKASEASVNPRIVKLNGGRDGITIPKLATLSIRDPDSLLDPTGPLRRFRTRHDLVKDVFNEEEVASL